MTGTINILTPALRGQLVALRKTQGAIDVMQLRLASGKKINSALDNPQNFFAARALSNRASDLQRLLDGIGQNIQVIKAADHGLQAISQVLNSAESYVTEIQQLYPNGGARDPDPEDTIPPLSELILADNPVAYWRLNDSAGTTAVNLGSGGAAIDGTYTGGVTLGADPLYTDGGEPSAEFSGAGQYVSIPNSNLINVGTHSRRTVELVFKANDTSGRQVLYEEGGATNSFTVYIDNGRLYTVGRDLGAWGPPTFNIGVSADKTYHVAFTFDFPNGTFTGYLNGQSFGTAAVNAIFPSHTARIGIGAMNNDAWYHNGSQNGTGNYFNGSISDVAVYNQALSAETIAGRYEAIETVDPNQLRAEYEALVDQIDQIVNDSGYRGTNLLSGDLMTTFFNEDRSSSLVSSGQSFNASALLVDERSFVTAGDIEQTLTLIREARDKVRSYGTTLANDLNIVKTRETMAQTVINTLEEGSDKLTLADQNELGAKMLALQVRQEMQFSVLAFNNVSIANFL